MNMPIQKTTLNACASLHFVRREQELEGCRWVGETQLATRQAE